uniref:Uncharacterized protein n=1 Tax=Coccidioides posadasii RMSCC 3488 TaxID=454284 RepID=A0A0J6F813_COCPO|nr:hypothetical protein CPAG_05433 [Coccidioides posadasii RMSCC 3488]
MAPIRRYLRISKHSVLECRIYLENPSDSRWLLDPRDPVLPRVFKSIRPLVLPKLREENERARAKKKSKPVKDVLVEDDFQVSIFLRETGTRHSITTQRKTFGDGGRISSKSNKLTGNSDDPIHIPDDSEQPVHPLLVEEEDSPVNLHDIPEAQPDDVGSEQPVRRRRRQRRAMAAAEDEDGAPMRPSKRARAETPTEAIAHDEKKLAMTTTYEGFDIWGWILCLLVSRRDRTKAAPASGESSNQALMEEWICTQAPQEYDEG